MRGRARPQYPFGDLVVLVVGVHHLLRGVAPPALGGGDRTGHLDPVHPWSRDLERRQHEVAEHLALARDLELRQCLPARPGQHHVHRQPPAPLGDEVILRRSHHLGSRAVLPVVVEEDLEAALVDPHTVAHGLELGVALDSPCMVELDVERHQLDAVERRVVADGHDVVEPVDADTAPTGCPCLLRHVGARPVDEHLLQLRAAVLTDIARLAGEDDGRVAVRGDDDVRVAVDDLETREIRHRPLEARVLEPATIRASRSCAAIAARTLANLRASSGPSPMISLLP